MTSSIRREYRDRNPVVLPLVAAVRRFLPGIIRQLFHHWWLPILIVFMLLFAACDNATPDADSSEPSVANAEQEVNSVDGNSADDLSSEPANVGEDATVSQQELTPEEIEGRVVLWHSWTGADGDALAAILTDFQERYPNLIVDTLFVAYDELPQIYADAVAAGGGPDLVFAPNWWLRDLVDSEAVQPLDNLVDPLLLERFWPAAVENLRVDGQLYGLPVNVDLVALYVNQGLIAPQAIPGTTDDWLALASKNPEAGAGLYTNLYHLYWGIPAFGGGLLNEDGVVVLDANPGAADFLAWLQEMNETQGNFVDLDYGMLLDRFKKGEYPFFVDGPWAAAELREVMGDDLVVTTLPAGPAGPAQPWLSADGLLVNPSVGIDQQQRALLLADYVTNAESGQQWAQLGQRLPANRDTETGDDPILNGFLKQAASAQSMPTSPEMDEVWGYGGDMLVKVLSAAMDPVAVVAETTALVNDANRK
jgi:arabinogalactan oligomer/maltooligosaccharide transport system substrate-binding protein